jgi:phytol kinase
MSNLSIQTRQCMVNQLLWIGFFLLLLLVLIVISEWLHRYLKWPTEQSRKFLHVSGGVMCLFFPYFFTSHWQVLILSSVAFAVLLVTFRSKLLPSVHQTKRNSIGSVLFPIPVYLCFLIATLKGNYLFYYLPIALLTIADTAAEIGGNKWGHLTKQIFGGQKTLAGSFCFLIAASLVTIILLGPVYHLSFTDSLKIGIPVVALTSIAELVTLHGWDNLSVPAVTVAILFIFT